jgi:hypothetical protein
MKNEIGGACGTYGDRKNVYRVLVGKPQGKTPHVRPRLRQNNIKMDLKELMCDGVDWI